MPKGELQGRSFTEWPARFQAKRKRICASAILNHNKMTDMPDILPSQLKTSSSELEYTKKPKRPNRNTNIYPAIGRPCLSENRNMLGMKCFYGMATDMNEISVTALKIWGSALTPPDSMAITNGE